MKSLRYITIIALGVIVVPFLGIPTGWKQAIFVVLGVGILISSVFIKKAILTCSHQEEVDTAGLSFQDSNIHEKEIELTEEGQEAQINNEDYEG